MNRKRSTTAKSKATPAPTMTEAAEIMDPTVTPEQRQQMIEVAAYYRAERRGFLPGDALGDWLEAEAEVDRLLRASASPAAQEEAETQPLEVETFEIQESEPRSIAKQERLKRIIKKSPQRNMPRVDSVEPGE